MPPWMPTAAEPIPGSEPGNRRSAIRPLMGLRFIPPLAFKTVGGALLIGAFGAAGYGAVANVGPSAWLFVRLPGGPATAALLSFLLSLLLWLLAALAGVLGLRAFTRDLPGLAQERETLERLAAGDRSDVDKILNSPGTNRGVGIGVALAGACLVSVAVGLYFTQGIASVRLSLLGLVCLGVGATMAITGKIPRR